MPKIQILRKSPIYCQLAVFLIYGTIKLAPLEQYYSTIIVGLNLLIDTCPKFAPWEFAAARLDYFKLLDLILNKLDWHIQVNEYSLRSADLLEIVLTENDLMEDMANRIQDYFDPTEIVFQRSAYIYAHQYPVLTDPVECSDQYVIFVEGHKGPVYYSCIPRFGRFQFLQTATYRLATGLVLIKLMNQEKNSRILVHIRFKLPRFQNGLPYDCSRLSPPDHLSLFRPSSECQMRQLEENEVLCSCNKPGTFALVHPVSDSRRLRPYFYNHLANSPLVWYLHQTLIGLLLSGQVFHLIIRCSKHAQRVYLRHTKSKRELHFVDFTIQLLFLQTLRIALQMISIFIADYNYCNLIGLAMNVIIITYGVVNLTISVAAFAIERTRSPIRMATQLMCVVYGAIIFTTVFLYMFTWGTYVQINCLPRDHLRLLVIPVLVVDVLTGVSLILYWFLKPYNYLSEWIGVLIHTGLTALAFVPTIYAQTPRFYLTVPFERLVYLTLWQASFDLLFRFFSKMSVLRFLWYCMSFQCIGTNKPRLNRRSSYLMPKLLAWQKKQKGRKQHQFKFRELLSIRSNSVHRKPDAIANAAQRRRGYFEKMTSDFASEDSRN